MENYIGLNRDTIMLGLNFLKQFKILYLDNRGVEMQYFILAHGEVNYKIAFVQRNFNRCGFTLTVPKPYKTILK